MRKKKQAGSLVESGSRGATNDASLIQVGDHRRADASNRQATDTLAGSSSVEAIPALTSRKEEARDEPNPELEWSHLSLLHKVKLRELGFTRAAWGRVSSGDPKDAIAVLDLINVKHGLCEAENFLLRGDDPQLKKYVRQFLHELAESIRSHADNRRKNGGFLRELRRRRAAERGRPMRERLQEQLGAVKKRAHQAADAFERSWAEREAALFPEQFGGLVPPRVTAEDLLELRKMQPRDLAAKIAARHTGASVQDIKSPEVRVRSTRR